jgi:hypothetical protein
MLVWTVSSAFWTGPDNWHQREVLELGTYCGYSAIRMVWGLSDAEGTVYARSDGQTTDAEDWHAQRLRLSYWKYWNQVQSLAFVESCWIILNNVESCWIMLNHNHRKDGLFCPLCIKKASALPMLVETVEDPCATGMKGCTWVHRVEPSLIPWRYCEYRSILQVLVCKHCKLWTNKHHGYKTKLMTFETNRWWIKSFAALSNGHSLLIFCFMSALTVYQQPYFCGGSTSAACDVFSFQCLCAHCLYNSILFHLCNYDCRIPERCFLFSDKQLVLPPYYRKILCGWS